MADANLQVVVERMVSAGEPEENIRLVIEHYGAPKQATPPPASATIGMMAPSTMAGPPKQSFTDRLLHGPQVIDPQSGEPIQVMGDPGILADISVGGASLGSAATKAKSVPGVIARMAGVSKARGGANIAEAVEAAKDVPLNTAGVQAAVNEMMQYSGVENVPRVVRALSKRLSSDVPFTVQKARLYSPAISRGSVNEWGNLTPNMQRLTGALKGPLNEAITEAAESVGKGEQYAKGVKEYARSMKAAKTYEETVKPAVKSALKLLLRGTAGGAAIRAGWNVFGD